MKILIKGGSVHCLDADNTVHRPGYVLVDDGRIAAVGEGQPRGEVSTADEIIDAEGMAVFPGFINTHSHAVLTALRGRAEDVDTITAVYGLMTPINEAMTPDESYALARGGFLEMLTTGISTVVESSTNMEAVAQAARDMGIRSYLVAGKIYDAVLSRVLDGEYHFDPSIGERTLAEATEFVDRWEGTADDRLRCMLGPHATDTCSRELWEKVAGLSRERDLAVTTHVLQNTQEKAQVERLHGVLPVELLRDVGVLNERLLAAHCVHITDRETDMMAEGGATLAHCPAILARRGSTGPLVPMMQRGINVGLGTDNMSGDMVEAMRFALTAARIREGSSDNPKPHHIMEMAAGGGARSIGRADDLGSLEVGKIADITTVSYDVPHMTPIYPDTEISTLVHCGMGRDVSSVIVDGQILLRDGQFQSGDAREIMRDAQEAATSVLGRIGVEVS
ncbi:MAG: amidohydrolase family protein [Bacillota bacterium]